MELLFLKICVASLVSITRYGVLNKQNLVNEARLLFIDIETSPIIGYTWGLYEQNVIERIKTFTILSVAYKWFNERTQVLACDSMTEKELLKKTQMLLSAADIVIAHNGDSFDIKKLNARFIINKIPLPSPYRTIDTKKAAKAIGAFDSNSLNNLGIDLDEGEKIKHRGFDMWLGCMAGIQKDWNYMKRYNKRDVDLLKKVYLRLRPSIKNHPSLAAYLSDKSCPKCGSNRIQERGIMVTQTMHYQRYQCQNCGGWSKSPFSQMVDGKLKVAAKKATIMSNV